jgi:hypothetical protein
MSLKLQSADTNQIEVMIDEFRSLSEEAGLIGMVSSDDGGVRNYLDDTEDGRRLSAQLTTVQTMCNEVATALEEQVQKAE